jgi:hypothetical protein
MRFNKIVYFSDTPEREDRVDWLVTRHLSAQAESNGRARLFLVVKQSLNPSSWRISHTNNCQKRIKSEKVTTPQSKESQELKKT